MGPIVAMKFVSLKDTYSRYRRLSETHSRSVAER